MNKLHILISYSHPIPTAEQRTRRSAPSSWHHLTTAQHLPSASLSTHTQTRYLSLFATVCVSRVSFSFTRSLLVKQRQLLCECSSCGCGCGCICCCRRIASLVPIALDVLPATASARLQRAAASLMATLTLTQRERERGCRGNKSQ